MPYLFVPLILLVLAALVWSWWTARSDRDPASSVHHFNRALSAMQPGDGPSGDRRPPAPQRSASADDPAADT